MGMITVRHEGNFSRTEKFFNKMLHRDYLNALDKYGQMGVEALASSTPTDSGETANSWTYEIVRTSDTTTISWLNTKENDGVNIAVILLYGHGTGTGGYVRGIDFVNPAMRPVFDKIANEAWKEVSSA